MRGKKVMEGMNVEGLEDEQGEKKPEERSTVLEYPSHNVIATLGFKCSL